MRSLFHINALQAFGELITKYRLSPVIDSDDQLYLVSSRGYALQISNDRDEINIWCLLLVGRDEILAYNILLSVVRLRGDRIPRGEMVARPATVREKLDNLALMLSRGASDVLDGDTTWLRTAGQPVPISPSVRGEIFDRLQAALPPEGVIP